MAKNKQRLKLGLWLTALAAIGGLFFFGLYEPQQQAIREQKILMETEKRELISIENFLNEHPDLAAYEAEMNKKEKVVGAMLPEDMQLSLFMLDIQKIAVQDHIVLNGMKPDKISRQDRYAELPIKIDAAGNYFQLLDFLKDIESRPRFARVKKLQVHAAENLLHCKFLLVIYARSAPNKEED